MKLSTNFYEIFDNKEELSIYRYAFSLYSNERYQTFIECFHEAIIVELNRKRCLVQPLQVPFKLNIDVFIAESEDTVVRDIKIIFG